MDNERRALPEGWEWKRLGDVVEILDGKRIPIKDEEREKRIAGKPVSERVPYYGATGQVGWIDDYIFNEELVLLGEDGAPFFDPMKNKAYIIDGKSWVNNHAHVLKAKSGVALNSFICNYLNVFEYNGYVSGTTRTKLIQSEMRKIPIPLPPLPTQRRIVSLLEKAEETTRLRAQADELTNRLLQSVFLEMFGDPVRNPKEWGIRKLQDLSEIVSGVTKGRKLSGNSVVSVPYLRVANVQDGYLDLKEIKTIDALPSEVEKYGLLEGDMLLTEGGDPDKLGRGAVWHNQIPNCIHQNHIFRVRVDKESIAPEFLSMLTGSAYGKMYFLKSAKQTTGIATINSTQLKNFPVLVPPLPLQQQFARIVEKVEAMRQSQNQSKQQIEDLFSALMQKAFRGEL